MRALVLAMIVSGLLAGCGITDPAGDQLTVNCNESKDTSAGVRCGDRNKPPVVVPE